MQFVEEQATVATGGAAHVLADAIGRAAGVEHLLHVLAEMIHQRERNIARFVPATKNACEAARVVITPAVAVAGIPVREDCEVATSTLLSARLAFWFSSAS